MVQQGCRIGADLGDGPVFRIGRKQNAMRLDGTRNVDWLSLAGVTAACGMRGAQSHDTGYGSFMAAGPIILCGLRSAAFLKPRPSLSRNDCHTSSQVIESGVDHRRSS